jgi:Leucine-rich repeat (LRR) protein
MVTDMKLVFLFAVTLSMGFVHGQPLVSENELNLQTRYLSVEQFSQNAGKLISVTITPVEHLRNLPNKLVNHEHLQKITIVGAQLGSLRNLELKLPSLQYLVMRGDSITSIPSLATLTNLKKIDFGANRIGNIPKEIFNIGNITSMDFSGQLVPLELPLIDVNDKLIKLDISDNRLVGLSRFFRFAKLSELDLSNCLLDSVPSSIKSLQELRILDLSENPIKNLPLWLCKMPNLRQIIIHDTELDKFPLELTAIQTLSFIDVRNTSIKLTFTEVERIKKRAANKFIEIYWDKHGSPLKQIKVDR